MTGHASASVSATGTLTVTRSTEAEIAALKHQVERLDRVHAEHATDVQRQLAEQREELRAHAVSVTQQGWQYLLWGAACSAFWTILHLFS